MNDTRKIQLLAVKLHQMFCPHEHGETCRWYMEKSDNLWETGQVHKRWFEQARIVTEYLKTIENYALGVDGAKGVSGDLGIKND